MLWSSCDCNEEVRCVCVLGWDCCLSVVFVSRFFALYVHALNSARAGIARFGFRFGEHIWLYYTTYVI